MHRYTIFLFFILSLVLGGVRAWAQDTPARESFIVTNPPAQMIAADQVWQSVELESADLPDFAAPFAINTANDSCSTATEFLIGNGDEDKTINSLTKDAADPDLTCMWGAPTSSSGYRTGWYKFTATASGVVSIKTFGSNYDTVLAVWKDVSPESVLDPCVDFTNSMQLVSCKDDSQGLTADTTISVRKGETYYIEVADWEASAPSPKTLQLQTFRNDIDSHWTLKASMPVALSRHATAVAGSSIYVIGGQKSQLGTVNIVTDLRRYDTLTNQWTTLQSMPGSGYSNTTAAFVDGANDNGRIYLPSGYTGADTYDMRHWAYDIQSNAWLEQTAITTGIPGTLPFAWATAVADPSIPGYYLTGGLESTEPFSTTATVKNQMYLYIPNAGGGTWLPRTDMNSPRYAHTAALVNGSVCVVGGISSGNVLLVDGECYTQGTGWATIAAMNIPRYAATSAVGLDGRWYVIGGLDAVGDAIAETEVYDPGSNTWTILPINDDLGGTTTLPPRAWPRGGTIGSTFYAIGGNNTPDQQPLALVESIFLPTDEILLPLIMSNYGDANRPDDNFNQARLLTLNVPQFRNFDTIDDYFDVYYFDLTASSAITARLSQVPSNSNYDLFVYDNNKFLRGKGNSVFDGVSEVVPLDLPAGRYYVVVKRVPGIGSLNTANYRIIVEK